MKIGIANAAEVDAVWPSIAKEMQRGCDKTGGGMSAGDLWQMCRSGNAFLLLIFTNEEIVCSSVWRFENWPSGTVFRCMGLSGHSMKVWVKGLYDFAMQQAQFGGTDRLIAEGRPGWVRVLSRYLSQPVKPLWQTFEVRHAGK
jgi:hypothetical protein